jgi:hypothetical protein
MDMDLFSKTLSGPAGSTAIVALAVTPFENPIELKT